MKQNNQQKEIKGEEGWELDAAEEAALDAAWAAERTPEFLERIRRQEAEYDKWIIAYLEKTGIQDIKSK